MAEPAAEVYIRQLLGEYGLESLTTWAMQALSRGLSAEQILQEMRDTPEFIARFPAIKERERLGLPPISPAEYVSYERQAAQLMRDAGLPPGFYDGPEDFTQLLVNDVSAAELNDRIQKGYTRMRYEVPQEVRDVFADWFGPSGDQALAAFYLDPDRAKPVLLDMGAQAFVGGTAKRFGFDLAQAQAARITAAGGEQQAPQAFSQLDEMRSYFDETITETADLAAESEGIDALFGLGGEGAAKVRRRQEERAAQFRGSGAGGTLGAAEDYTRGQG